MRNIFATLLMSLLIAGCGSGSSSSSNETPRPPDKNSSSSSSSLPAPPASSSESSTTSSSSSTDAHLTPVLTGVLLDSAVINAGYQTPTLNGFTNELGGFEYRDGEGIRFSIGVMQLPEVPGAEIITMLDYSDPRDINNQIVINIIRLLQSLDSDGNPDNGIQLSAAAINTSRQLDLDVEPQVFAQSPDLLAWLLEAGGPHQSLISTEQAQAHFQKTLDFVYGASSSSSSLTASSQPANSSSSTTISSRSSVSTSVASSSVEASSSAVSSNTGSNSSSAISSEVSSISSSASSSSEDSSTPAGGSSSIASSIQSSSVSSDSSSSDVVSSSSDGGSASSESSSSSVSSESSSSTVSSEASSSSAPVVCNYDNDFDCDGIPNPLDTTFSCNIDDSTSHVFSQVLSSEAFAENNSLLLGTALNPSNVLIQGEGSSSDLVIALTGAAGVRVVNSSGVWEGAVSQPGKIGIYFSAPSSLLTANILGGLQLLVDGVEVPTTGSVLHQVDMLGGNANYVWLVNKPDVDFTSVTFRARSVIGLATFDYRKLCIEQPFPSGGGASSASSDSSSSDDGASSSDAGAASSESSSSIVSSESSSSSLSSDATSSEGASSSAAPACAIDDADCDGVSDAVDSTFSCRGDGTPEGALSSFRQLLVSDVAGITTWNSGLSTAANISNLLAPGDGNFATLSVVLTGTAGVDMALEASQPSGLTSPGRVAFVVSENSTLLPQELLGGVGIQFDNIATEYTPTLVSASLNLDAPTGYAMTVISVQKPDSDYQSIRFRQGSVLGVSPTLRLHKVCIEES